jgi:nitronate monooxygenase
MNPQLHTTACDLLGCDYPIVLAGMGGVSRAELVAVVTQAGGYGFLGMVREQPERIRAEIDRVRARTPRAFGVNLIPAATEPSLLEVELVACIEARIAAVALFWDLYPDIVRRLRDEGILVTCQIGSAREAEEAQIAGAHLLVAQGREAGGHVRGHKALRTLLPEVLAITDLPVLAAGGLVDGRDLAEVLSVGAQGAMLGTAFLATEESFAHDYHKRRIIEATADQTLLTQAFHINWPPGAPVRVLANSVTRGERGDPCYQEGEKTQIGDEAGRPVYLFSTDSPLRTTSGDLEAMALYAGQGIDRITAIVSAADRLQSIVAEAEAALAINIPAHGTDRRP